MSTFVDSLRLRRRTAALSPARMAMTLLAVGLTTVLGLVLAAPPAAAAHPEDYNWIQAMGRSRDCLDLPPATAFSDGGRVLVYGCHSPGAADQWNQRWRVYYEPGKSTFQIVSSYSGLCLQANPFIFGNIEVWTCDGSDQQSWHLLVSPAAATRAPAPVPAVYQSPYTLANRYYSLARRQLIALDIPSAPGSRPQLSPYNRSAVTQAWDGYELQCAAAYHLHFSAIENVCR